MQVDQFVVSLCSSFSWFIIILQWSSNQVQRSKNTVQTNVFLIYINSTAKVLMLCLRVRQNIMYIFILHVHQWSRKTQKYLVFLSWHFAGRQVYGQSSVSKCGNDDVNQNICATLTAPPDRGPFTMQVTMIMMWIL